MFGGQRETREILEERRKVFDADLIEFRRILYLAELFVYCLTSCCVVLCNQCLFMAYPSTGPSIYAGGVRLLSCLEIDSACSSR
jgi:hypothetical protein